jgi:hypothetical protein
MNIRQKSSLTLLTFAAIGFAGIVNAQTPPTSEQAKKEMAQDKKDPLAMQSSGGEDWSMLKGNEKGYVEKADALPNSWLEHNFASCDKDSDGKVTELEYTKCLKAKP